MSSEGSGKSAHFHRLAEAFVALKHTLSVGRCFPLQLNLCKAATLKKTTNWFSRPNYGLRQVKEHSAILLTFIKLPFVIKISVLSIFEWPF